MEARANIIAENKEQFLHCLQEEIHKVTFELIEGGADFLITIKTKNIEPEFVACYIDENFRRVDGQYTYHGEFVSRREIENKIFKFSKEISIIVNQNT